MVLPDALTIYMFLFIYLAASGLSWWCPDSVVVAHGFSCPAACEILVPWPEIEPAPPALQGRFLTTGPPGKSPSTCFNIFTNAASIPEQPYMQWHLLSLNPLEPFTKLKRWHERGPTGEVWGSPQPVAGHHAVISGQPWTGPGHFFHWPQTWQPRDSLFLQDQGGFPGFLACPSSLHTKREADKIKRTGFAQLEKDFDGS